jgi:glutamate dehydrogenase
MGDPGTDHQSMLAGEIRAHFDGDQARGDFSGMLFSDAASQNHADFSAALLIHIASEAFDLHLDRAPGQPRIEVLPLDTADRRGRSLIFIANDDMPFLLDSVLGELNAKGIGADLVLHPTMKVARDVHGRWLQIGGPGDSDWGDGAQESLILAIVDRVSPAREAALKLALADVLSSVKITVIDWRAMMERLRQGIKVFMRHPPKLAAGVVAETEAFCNWLVDGQFTFLGVREYELVGEPEAGELVAVPDSGLGVLRDPSFWVLSRGGRELETTPEIREFMFAPRPLIIAKSSILSKVHRRAHMDYIGLKIYDEQGAQTGELRIVGLFTSQAYTERPEHIPFLRQHIAAVLRRAGFAATSHDGKALLNVLENFPRDELFQIGLERLLDWTRSILALELRPRVKVLARRDRFDRFVSVLVYVPRDRFTSVIREQIGDMLAQEMGGHVSAFTPFFPEGALVRVHYIIGRGATGHDLEIDVNRLEDQITALGLTWSDRLRSALDGEVDEISTFGPKYHDAFEVGYTDLFAVDRALSDIRRIERLSDEHPAAIDFELVGEEGKSGLVRATVYRFDEPIPLSERVPVLENFGFRSVDERSFRITPNIDSETRVVALHDMALEPIDARTVDIARHDQRLETAFLAVRHGEADDDPFNRLVVAAAADWREVAVLRAYVAYLRQLATPFGPRYVATTLIRYPAVAKDLIALFRVRFDPDGAADEARTAEQTRISNRIEAALADVPSLDEDRIIRSIRNLIQATLRTNFFQRIDGCPRETISFKFAPRNIEAMPEPKPFREIWVYSPRVEGVHLRFAPIARGGLRWTDRAHDFRTEVLGLCKAQQVKNAVIIPEGAKGGFLPKRLPSGGREAQYEEGVAAYQIFVSALLDITDKLIDGQVEGPERVVRHDDDDPYLVVAADKGTATFSDFANEISESKGHWLNDAFASGGSAGYDHKKMGITARGAWECVKRHFREMDVDIQAEPFTAVAVGDMSGDVFGNGMLLSEQTRLIAAFDHRDIFVDPSPDAARSYHERSRLFGLVRSSWQDYDTKLISKGGGVFSRAAKSINVTPETADALGITSATVTPIDLMRAILGAEVDLLWFGGIGTYIRASTESDDKADDRANDVIRLAAADVRAKVIGEGANLGITQSARIEFAERGGHINADFIDNSAGVNSSDMEVNIKIALGQAEAAGRIDRAGRNRVLESMTTDVAQSCLANNYRQSLAISLAECTSVAEAGFLARLTEYLEGAVGLDRALDHLPGATEVVRRQADGRGYSRPEIAVLLSWAKIALANELMLGVVGEDSTNEALLRDYFPKGMRQPFADQIRDHQLRREIVVNRITNDMINEVGPTMAVRLADAWGGDGNDAAFAYLAIREIYDYSALWQQVDALDGLMEGAAQLDLYGHIQMLMFEQISRLIGLGRDDSGLRAMVAEHAAVVAAVDAMLEEVISPGQLSMVDEIRAQLAENGAPHDVAMRVARLYPLTVAPTAGNIAAQTGVDLRTAAAALYRCLGFFRVGELRQRTSGITATDYYDRLAIAGALGVLENAAGGLARDMLQTNCDTSDVGVWVTENAPIVSRAKSTIDAIAGGGELTVSRLSVAAAQVRDLAG